jgi:hypothetical protein
VSTGRRPLAVEGIDRPELMPTHDNVAICLTEREESLSLPLTVVPDAGMIEQAAEANVDPGEPSVNTPVARDNRERALTGYLGGNFAMPFKVAFALETKAFQSLGVSAHKHYESAALTD